MLTAPPPSFVPLGEAAWLVYFADEAAAIQFASTVRAANFPWLEDVVPAYASVGVFVDLRQVEPPAALQQLRGLPPPTAGTLPPGRTHRIPCCYDFAPDMGRVCAHTGLDAESVIALHAGTEYTVYAIGFTPGFPYLGYLPAALQGVPRLGSPRVRVEPGSVGLTGKQTGLYPLARPGGWNLIGRTPLELVHLEEDYFPLQVGDRIRFERIDASQFEQLQGRRLTT